MESCGCCSMNRRNLCMTRHYGDKEKHGIFAYLVDEDAVTLEVVAFMQELVVLGVVDIEHRDDKLQGIDIFLEGVRETHSPFGGSIVLAVVEHVEMR